MKQKNLEKTKLTIIICSIIVLLIISTALIVTIYKEYTAKQVSAKEIYNEEEIFIEFNEEYLEEIENLEEIEEEITEETENSYDNKKSENRSTLPYYIKVNYGAQTITVYKQDENGDYTIPYKAMACSTGVATPKSGVYAIPAKWEWRRLLGNVYGHYSTHITGNILFHSVPYLRKEDKASLEYWEYDKLGTYASAGCVRLTVSDAQWIFYNCDTGTKVEFYSSSDPGPLGKPSTKKISSYPEYLRNWDPTDPDPENPWRTYERQEKTEDSEEEEIKNDNENKEENIENDVKNDIVEDNNEINEIEPDIDNEISNEIDSNTITNDIDNEVENIENKE